MFDICYTWPAHSLHWQQLSWLQENNQKYLCITLLPGEQGISAGIYSMARYVENANKVIFCNWLASTVLQLRYGMLDSKTLAATALHIIL